MTSFFSWYILITLLGWITFPLAYRLLPALADRGYTLARALGLILWGYIFWLFASLGMAQNDMGGLLLGLVIVGGLSAWSLFTNYELRITPLTDWLKENKKLIITTEVLFLLAFGFMAFFRSANPEILGTEKPMELMFINGIMNSPTFPPRDLWLSGYSISYYYFGYVITAMLASFTGVPATMAFNLMLALIFGLAAVGAYGILYNLLAIRRSDDETANYGSRFTFHALLAPLFLASHLKRGRLSRSPSCTRTILERWSRISGHGLISLNYVISHRRLLIGRRSLLVVVARIACHHGL